MRRLKHPLALAVSVSLIAGLTSGAAFAQDTPPEVTATGTLTERIEASIAADGAALAGNPDDVHSYVESRIGFESYDGVLKGAVGAYLTGTGNGADQAQLAARLLAAGDPTIETRFAVCAPDEALASVLAEQAQATVAGRGLAIDHIAEVSDGIEDETLRAAISELVELRNEVKADAERAGDRLADDLFGGGYLPAETQTEAAPAHVWLQVLSDGAWIDLDTTSEGGVTRCDVGDTYETLPDSMRHAVRIGLVSEERIDGQLAESELLTAGFPLADLAAARLSLVFGEPAGLVTDDDPASQLAPYTPLLRVDGESWPGMPIELPRVEEGFVGDLNESIGGVTGLFDELPGGIEEAEEEDGGSLFGGSDDSDEPAGELFGDLGGSLFGGDDSDAGSELTGLWLDVELTTPDGEITTLRSELLDRIGIAARVEGTAGSAELAPLDKVLGDYALASSLWQIGLLTGEVAAFEAATTPALDVTSVDSYSAHVDSLLRAFPAVRRDMGGVMNVPAVVIASLAPAINPLGAPVTRLSLDALHVPAPTPADEYEAARDALATIAAERLLAASLGDAVEHPDDSGSVFSRAQDQGARLTWLTPGEASSSIAASPRALARIGARLDGGFAVLAPESPADFDGLTATAYWTIDPASGIVRDEHENGRHAETTEYTVNTKQVLTPMQRLRRFGCAISKPLATVTLVLFLSTGAAPASPLYEPLSEIVEAAAAAEEAEAGRRGAETAACALG